MEERDRAGQEVGQAAGQEVGQMGHPCRSDQKSCTIQPLRMNCYKLWLEEEASQLGPIRSKPVYLSPIDHGEDEWFQSRFMDLLWFQNKTCIGSPAVFILLPTTISEISRDKPKLCCFPCSETPHPHLRDGRDPQQRDPAGHLGAPVSAHRGAPVSASVPLAVHDESQAGVAGEAQFSLILWFNWSLLKTKDQISYFLCNRWMSSKQDEGLGPLSILFF